MTRFFSIVLLLVSLARATPLTADLGAGLSYHRAHALPADLPSGETLTGPCVLDLRFATGDAAAASALSAWLKFHATPHRPVFVLADTTTSTPILTVLSARNSSPGLIVLGAAAPGFSPDLALAVPAETERSSYEAAEHGTPLEQLVNATMDKPRNDEAKLARERLPETASAEPDFSVVPPAAPAAKPVAPPPLIDAVLQRAVHLHRTLVALKKI